MIDNAPFRIPALLSAAAAVCLAGGCSTTKDIAYAWNMPDSITDCPANTVFVDERATASANAAGSGVRDFDGTGIVDRDGTGIVDRDGTGIVDREGDDVLQFCFKPCAGGEVPSGPVRIVWTNKDEFVLATRDCVIAPGN